MKSRLSSYSSKIALKIGLRIIVDIAMELNIHHHHLINHFCKAVNNDYSQWKAHHVKCLCMYYHYNYVCLVGSFHYQLQQLGQDNIRSKESLAINRPYCDALYYKSYFKKSILFGLVTYHSCNILSKDSKFGVYATWSNYCF